MNVRRVHQRAPAEWEMQRHFGVPPPSVHQMVLTLERGGFIRRQPGVPRSIEVLVSTWSCGPPDPLRWPVGDPHANGGKTRSEVVLETPRRKLLMKLAFVKRTTQAANTLLACNLTLRGLDDAATSSIGGLIASPNMGRSAI
jgi:hypothetical protein